VHGGGIVGGGIGGMGSQSLTEVGALPPIDLLSSLAAWLPGCLAAWLPGCLAGWTCAAVRVFAWSSPFARFNLNAPARAPPAPHLPRSCCSGWAGGGAWRRRACWGATSVTRQTIATLLPLAQPREWLPPSRRPLVGGGQAWWRVVGGCSVGSPACAASCLTLPPLHLHDPTLAATTRGLPLPLAPCTAHRAALQAACCSA
jgi:hypothetical protein